MKTLLQKIEEIESMAKAITKFDSSYNFCTRDQEFYIAAHSNIPMLCEVVKLLAVELNKISVEDNPLYMPSPYAFTAMEALTKANEIMEGK